MGLLNDEVGMITGRGSGIGRATCIKFAAEGAQVLVADISEKDGPTTVAQIAESGGEAILSRT
jgi:NAD(P)-dependent dehydrogenase (short-subunit alcohol dehydrogenase family)